jgi:hypothetical protein
MSGTATIAITVGVAVAVLVGFFIVYYLGNVANSIYDVKVGVRRDFDKKIKELQEWAEKDAKQRISWMRDENKAEGKRFKESVEGHLEETFGEMQKEVERLRADVTSLQLQVQNLQQGRGMKSSYNSSVQAERASSNPSGEVDVARVITPPTEVAPDMSAVINKTTDEPVPTEMAGASPIKNRPSPPPPPTSKQPAGRSSIEEKAKQKQKKKKRRDPDAFESFDQFSKDFKAGG